jgi:hypothetical protein
MRFPLVATILVFSLMVANAYALGIATDFGSETVRIPVTQKTAYYSFRVQNMENRSIPVIILVYSDMAILMNDSAFTVPPNSTGAEFLIRITLPDYAGIGNVYNISYDVKEAGEDESGQVTLGQGIGKSFRVAVVDPSNPDYVPLNQVGNETGGGFDYTLVGIAVAVFVAVMFAVYFVYRRKTKNQYPYGQYRY